MEWSSVKALVTGATGFLGRALAERLVGEGHNVTALGRNAAIGQELATLGMTFISADLADETRVVAACEGMAYVFHCGALSSVWGPYDDFLRANVLGTRHVIAGCRRHGVKRLIHVSTPSLYFDFRDRLAIREADPLPPRGVNAYAETKRLAELEVAIAHRAGLEVISIRPRALFGPRDTAILPRLLRANAKGFLPLIDGGRALADVTYVDNVVDALLLCRDAGPDALGKTYNISNGEPMAMIDLLTRVFTRLETPMNAKRLSFGVAYALAGALELAANTVQGGREPTLTRYTVGVLGKSQTLDIAAARDQLGYRPRVSVDEGLAQFVSWWKEQPR